MCVSSRDCQVHRNAKKVSGCAVDNFHVCMLPDTKSVWFFYYFIGKQRTAFVAGSIQYETLN
jgi:hypothetical protein